MKTIHLSVGNISERSYLEFGERGENAVTEVLLDFSAWVEEFGEGTVSLYVKRNGDASAYPVFLEVEGAEAKWTISDTDTYKQGRGEAEFVYIVGEQIEKTAVFNFFVKRDIGKPSDVPPDGYEIWLDKLSGISAEAQEYASDAEDSSELAQEAVEHYPKIVDDYWYVWDVDDEEFVNTDVMAEGHGFEVSGTVASVSELPQTAKQGTYYNVGTEAPYTMYMYDHGEWISQGIIEGPQGVTFTPSVSEQGVISWTNDGGKVNPPSVNIKGPQGVQGEIGETGTTFTPSVSPEGVISWTNDGGKVNPESVNIKGPQGIRGETGETGDTGATFTPSVSSEGVISWTNDKSLPNPQSVNIKGPQGERGATGQGVPSGGQVGQVLKKKTATDYDTEWDDEGGLPIGGSVGEVLRKNSSTDGDASWAKDTYIVTITFSSNVYSMDKTFAQIKEAHDNGLEVVAIYNDGQGELRYKLVTVSSARIEFNRYAYNSNINLYEIVTFRIASDETVTRIASATVDSVSNKLLPSGGTQGQVLKKASNTAYDTTWGDVHDLPSGGTQGQILKKNSATNYDVVWGDAGAAGMKVTCTKRNNTVTADKTYAEILAAINSGVNVFAVLGTDVFTLYKVNADSIQFNKSTYTSGTSTFKYEDGLTFTSSYIIEYGNSFLSASDTRLSGYLDAQKYAKNVEFYVWYDYQGNITDTRISSGYNLSMFFQGNCLTGKSTLTVYVMDENDDLDRIEVYHSTKMWYGSEYIEQQQLNYLLGCATYERTILDGSPQKTVVDEYELSWHSYTNTITVTKTSVASSGPLFQFSIYWNTDHYDFDGYGAGDFFQNSANNYTHATLAVLTGSQADPHVDKIAWCQSKHWEYEEIDGDNVAIARAHFANTSYDSTAGAYLLRDYEVVYNLDDGNYVETNVTTLTLGGSISGVSF